MQPHRRLAFYLALVLVTATAGCATTGAADGEPMSVEFAVDNNRPGVEGISAFLVTDSGSRVMLGPVESNRTGRFARVLRPGHYRLVAGRVGADDIISERFRIEASTAVISWNVNQNQITFGQH